MKINNESLTESVAELMEDVDTILESLGISIDESIQEPQNFVETVAAILDENDLDEDVEEALCLAIGLIESFMLNKDIQLEEDEDDSDEETEVAEASMLSKLNKSMRRRIEKGAPMGVHWKHMKGDELAGKEPHAMLRAYLDKKSKVMPMHQPKHAEPEKKKAAGEDVENVDALVNAVVEMVEAAGYEVPDDLPVETFLEAVEQLMGEDPAIVEGLMSTLGGIASAPFSAVATGAKKIAKTLSPETEKEEGLGGAVAKAGIKMLRSKTAAWAANKLAKAGTKALVRKMGASGKPAGSNEDLVDSLLATMVEVIVKNGYEFEGSAENFDPKSFIDAASEIAETDEDLAEDVSAWLKKTSAELKAKLNAEAEAA